MEKGRNDNYETNICLTPLDRLVEFSDREGMESALRELDDTKLDERRIRLNEEKPKQKQEQKHQSNRSRIRSRNLRLRTKMLEVCQQIVLDRDKT